MVNATQEVVLSQSGGLTLDAIEAVAVGRAKVSLDPAARDAVAAFRARAEAEIARQPEKPVYGLNTGFGSNFRDNVSAADLLQLQRNLILSHCAGTGEPAPAPIVRATMLMRAASLARGRSVVRPVLIETLIAMLNNGVTPAVPRYGSVSASGDLAPLSHIAAVLIGEGRVVQDGRAVPTKDYLAKNPGAFTPVTLQIKEGLALNNGCQYSNAWGALTAQMMRRLMQAAVLNTALGVEVMRGMGRPFRADLHALRPHPGSQAVARWVYELLDGYAFKDVPTETKYAYDKRIQDPYNLRCAAQVLGPCLDLIERAERTLTIEANSVTDNPIDLNTAADDGYALDEITSGGHFHGMPLAIDTYGLLQAAGVMARLANLRCARIVDASHNGGLGPQVRGPKPSATQSGLMLAEYSTAGLCNHIWGLASPSHLMSISTDSGQEDHVSMAANVAIRAYEAAERLAEILAGEMAFAAQAAHVRSQDAKDAGLALGARTQSALKAISEVFPLVLEDRELTWDMQALAEKVLNGEIVAAAGYSFARH
ncbi:MAG: histidine ammonia-lyase [Hyphomonadaceae bacterium]